MLFTFVYTWYNHVMNVAIREKKQLLKKKLNIKQDMFCKMYATNPHCLGNGTDCYIRAYSTEDKIISYEVAKTSAGRFLLDDRFTARINEYLELDGFNNETVDKHHLFLIKQKKDLGVSMKGIEHYNRLKKRIDNKLEIIMPRPIMELDDDEVIHKIDKGKARDISQGT